MRVRIQGVIESLGFSLRLPARAVISDFDGTLALVSAGCIVPDFPEPGLAELVLSGEC